MLAGSANLMTLPRVADSWAGRVEVVQLLPLARAGIGWGRPSLLARVFEGEIPEVQTSVRCDDLVAAVLSRGYPEVLTRRSGARRQDWYLSYVDAIVQRDVRDIARVEQAGQMPRLLRCWPNTEGN